MSIEDLLAKIASRGWLVNILQREAPNPFEWTVSLRGGKGFGFGQGRSVQSALIHAMDDMEGSIKRAEGHLRAPPIPAELRALLLPPRPTLNRRI